MIDKREVLRLLTDQGIEVSERSLLRWEREGLIPGAKRTNGGRGVGIRAEYPSECIAEAIATWNLLHGLYKMSPSELARIRRLALKIEKTGGIYGPAIADAFYGDRKAQRDLNLAQDWLAYKHEALHKYRADCEVCRNLYPEV